jgi:hypothetical protein
MCFRILTVPIDVYNTNTSLWSKGKAPSKPQHSAVGRTGQGNSWHCMDERGKIITRFLKIKSYKSWFITILDRCLGLRKVDALRISRQSAHEGGKVVRRTQRPSLSPPGDNSDNHFCNRLNGSQGHSAVGSFKSIKIPMTPSGIETTEI